MSASHKKITNESQMNSEKIKNSDFRLPGVKKYEMRFVPRNGKKNKTTRRASFRG